MKQIYRRFGLLFFYSFLLSFSVIAQDEINAAAFSKKMTATGVQLLDVRTAAEFRSGHLQHALQADWLRKDEFAERTKFLDKQKPLLIYCVSGIRSAQAARLLREQGFTNVQNLEGGLVAWKMAGNKIETTENIPQLSLESYKQSIPAQGTILVEFGADWCPPCQAMLPVLDKLGKDLKGKYAPVRIDGGVHTDLMKALNVPAIPFFIVYKNGQETWRKQGVVAYEDLKAQLQN